MKGYLKEVLTMKKKWEAVHDCDEENGNPTCWALEVSKSVFYWINETSDGKFEIIDHDAHTVLMNCKSLTSAKRWAAMNLLVLT